MSASEEIRGSMKKKTTGCLAPIFAACVPSVKQQPGGADDAARSRLSFSFADQNQPESIIDPAASVVARKDGRQQQQQHCAVIVGTIFGSRSGRVTFCVQRDPAVPPPFLFELSVPMQSLAAEMASGLLRIALECHRSSGRSSASGAAGENAAAAGGSSRPRNVWTASCNGRDAGHAVRRPPTEWERGVLESMRTMTAGVGALPAAEAQQGINEDVMYMRATYERVVGSKDAVSYHLISPRTAGDSPPQELSLFLLRTRGD